MPLLLALSIACATRAEAKTPPVAISLENPDRKARATKAALGRLLSEHDLSRWIFTRKVVVDGDASVIPHSHPVLTLHGRHHRDPELLLSTFVHEQLHWFVDARPKQVEAAIAELSKLYPEVPVGHPEGARNKRSTYEHLMICHLEIAAMRALLGELRALTVLQFWARDHYTWIYRRVLEDERKIEAVVKKHGLIPKP